jgi:hypothetical protein
MERHVALLQRCGDIASVSKVSLIPFGIRIDARGRRPSGDAIEDAHTEPFFLKGLDEVPSEKAGATKHEAAQRPGQ